MLISSPIQLALTLRRGKEARDGSGLAVAASPASTYAETGMYKQFVNKPTTLSTVTNQRHTGQVGKAYVVREGEWGTTEQVSIRAHHVQAFPLRSLSLSLKIARAVLCNNDSHAFAYVQLDAHPPHKKSFSHQAKIRRHDTILIKKKKSATLQTPLSILCRQPLPECLGPRHKNAPL